jgi:hypothetical protein
MTTEEFEIAKNDLAEAIRYELSNWDMPPKLLRALFTAAVADLTDEDFAAGEAAQGRGST